MTCKGGHTLVTFHKNQTPAYLEDFAACLWSRLVVQDVPTLYYAIVTAWHVLALVEAKGASRSPIKALMLSYVQCALSLARLRAVGREPKWPRNMFGRP